MVANREGRSLSILKRKLYFSSSMGHRLTLEPFANLRNFFQSHCWPVLPQHLPQFLSIFFPIHMHSKNEGRDERIRLVARRTFAPVNRFSTFGFFVFGSCRWIRTTYNGDFSMRQYMYIALCRNNARNIWSLTASCK